MWNNSVIIMARIIKEMKVDVLAVYSSKFFTTMFWIMLLAQFIVFKFNWYFGSIITVLTDAEGQNAWEGINSPWEKLLCKLSQRMPVVQ